MNLTIYACHNRVSMKVNPIHVLTIYPYQDRVSMEVNPMHVPICALYYSSSNPFREHSKSKDLLLWMTFMYNTMAIRTGVGQVEHWVTTS